MPTIIHKYNNFVKSPRENIPQYDFVDRTGYISPDMQLERLESAGVTLKRLNTEQFSYLYDDVVNAMSNDSVRDLISNYLMQNAHYDKRDIDDLYKSKIQQYIKARNDYSKVSNVVDSYNKLQERKLKDQKALDFYSDVHSAIRKLKEEGKI